MKEARKIYKDELYLNGTTNGNTDPAFKNIHKNTTAFHIWKVENLSIVAVPKDQHGTFYDTEAYVIFSAAQYGYPTGTETISREVRGTQLEYHVHFWLGSSCPPDKSGVAAYKTVELDTHLGGITTQYRETQSYESARFISYFKNGIQVFKGDKQSQSLYKEPKLYKIKGRRVPILMQLPKVDWKFFNSSDVFLILTESIIFEWIGRASNPTERLNCTKIALKLRDLNKIPNIVFVDDGYEQTLEDNLKEELNKFLPLNNRSILPSEEDLDEEFGKETNFKQIRLYKCSESSGKYRVAEVKLSPLQQSDLDSNDVFILDHGWHGIWVWVGKNASEKEKIEGLRNARGFVKKKKYPNHTKVVRVLDGLEPSEFKMFFSIWRDKEESKSPGKLQTVKTAKIVLTKFDAIFMHDRPSLAAEMQLIDDGSGLIKIWKVGTGGSTEIPKERHGIFFSGDSYVVWYNYNVNSNEKFVIYSWLGFQTTQEEAEIAVSKARELNSELGGEAVFVRVYQENEPAHFLQLFKGKMMIFKGRGTDFDESGRNLKNPAQFLLQVAGSSSYSGRGVQVHCRASSLNSNYCFVLRRGKRSHVWCGNMSTGDQRETAKGFAGKDFQLVLEGKEQDDFWALLGGKNCYNTTKLSPLDGLFRTARLFHYSRKNGVFKVEEILNFSQSDLKPEEILLLDSQDAIFVWIGKSSPSIAAQKSLDIAEEYLEIDPADRNRRICVTQIKQEREPPNFRGFFSVWDTKLWKNHKSFEEARRKLEGKTSKSTKKESRIIKSEGSDEFDQFDKYPMHILKGPNEKLPQKVNPLNKELYLTHDDFVSLFNMTYKDFEKLPKWKQQELKKKAGLF